MDKINNVFLTQPQWDSMDDAAKDKNAVYDIVEVADDGLIKKVSSRYEYDDESGSWEERVG